MIFFFLTMNDHGVLFPIKAGFYKSENLLSFSILIIILILTHLLFSCSLPC